jgi:hypothetical protein
MKQEDVVALAALLNSTAEDVKTAVDNGGVSELINGFLPTVKIMPERDFSTYSENLKRQAINELDKTKLPRDLYEYVKGSVLEKTERELAKKHGVADGFTGMDELVEQIIKTKTKTAPDDETAKLKQRITEIENEWAGKLAIANKSFEDKFIDTELGRVIGELPIDAEGDKLTNQQKIVRAMLKESFTFSMDEGIPVAMKDGKAIQDSKLDPVPIKDVVYQFAKDYVNLRPEQGGRGSSSSTSGSRKMNFPEYCEKNHILPNSMEFFKAKSDLEAKGYKLEY